MRVASVSLRDFRNIERAAVEIGPSATVVTGPNGAGKTNLLEADLLRLHGPGGALARTSASCSAQGAEALRVEVEVEGDGEEHSIEVGFTPGASRSGCCSTVRPRRACWDRRPARW